MREISLPSPIHCYHSRADLICPIGPFEEYIIVEF